MKSILLWVFVLVSFTCYSQKTEIPDKNFEQALIHLKIDSDQELNGYLLERDAALITSLDLSNYDINDLSGIEAFTSLQYLYCYDNQLTNVDFEDNIGLNILATDVNDIINPNRALIDMVWFD